MKFNTIVPVVLALTVVPGFLWFDQILNITAAAMLGAVGFGGIGLSLWFAIGAPVLW